MFWCILCRLGVFGTICCLTKLGAKRYEQVQKFVPRSRVGIFGIERTRSTLLDPYLMFRCISNYLGAFGTDCCVTTLSSKQAKLVQKFMPRSRVGIFRNERTHPPHWTLNSCCGVFCTIWVHLVPIGYLTKLGAKRAEVVQNFVP